MLSCNHFIDPATITNSTIILVEINLYMNLSESMEKSALIHFLLHTMNVFVDRHLLPGAQFRSRWRDCKTF